MIQGRRYEDAVAEKCRARFYLNRGKGMKILSTNKGFLLSINMFKTGFKLDHLNQLIDLMKNEVR